MIERVTEHKREYIQLLLLADEQESMIDQYLDRGELFVLFDEGIRTICVVTDEGYNVCELKNIATVPQYQGRGYGKQMIQFLCDRYCTSYDVIMVGTGDSPLTLPFYRKCGFTEAYRVKNFFTDHYDHPIFECGKQLTDMIYLKKELYRKRITDATPRQEGQDGTSANSTG